MRHIVFVLAAASMLLAPLSAGAQSDPTPPPTPSTDAPFAKLAADFGLTTLAHSYGTKDRSHLDLSFVRPGETQAKWTKMMTVNILKVKAVATVAATRTVISGLKKHLAERSAHVIEFTTHLTAPVSASFRATTPQQSDAGIAYSPATEYVAVIQILINGNKESVAADSKTLKAVLAAQAR